MKKTVSLMAIFLSVCMLAGCPMGDRLDQRYKTPETAEVSVAGDAICFHIPAPSDFQPVTMMLAPRGTPFRERWFAENPHVQIEKGELCIPSSVYTFPDKGQFIADFTLASPQLKKKEAFSTRRFVVGFELSKGTAYGLRLNNDEF